MPHPSGAPVLSPPASASPPISSVSQHTSALPSTRAHPLTPGSSKEIALINYLDDKLLRITRRYAKKFSSEHSQLEESPGYTNFDEVVADLDVIFDIVWISGTPTIQIPYLLTIAGTVCSYMSSFSFSTAMFLFLPKLDTAFYELLKQCGSATGLASDETYYHMSSTEKVRLKSLVMETRVIAVDVATAYGYNASIQDISDSENAEEESEFGNDRLRTASSENIAMAISRIYKRTLDILGDALA